MDGDGFRTWRERGGGGLTRRGFGDGPVVAVISADGVVRVFSSVG